MTLHRTGVAPIAITCAMESELGHLREVLPPATDEWRCGRLFHQTVLDGCPIVLAACGVGMLSAAAVTESCICSYSPRAVLNYGCAGSHRVDLLPGDLVIGTRVVAYDSMRTGVDNAEQVRMRYLHKGVQMRADYLPPAPELLSAALSAAADLQDRHEPWPASSWPEGAPHRSPRHFVGTIASADRWNRSRERIEALSRAHESLCEDMEAAAIALICASHDTPFLSIKDISNNELLRPTDSASFGAETLGQLGRRAARRVLTTIRELLPRDSTSG